MSLDALLSQVQEKGKDQTQASAGGDYTPPAAGPTGARLVGYYEVGQHETTFKGEKKTKDIVRLVFELIGKKHEPKEINGEKVPTRISVDLTLSQFENSGFFKMFSRLRTTEKHFVQLLGQAFLVDVVHREVERQGKKVTYANIDRDTVRKPTYQTMNPETNELEDRVMEVGPALTPKGAFVWEFATPEYWDAIYLPGEYAEKKNEQGVVIAPAKSKNVLQLEIASALNFKGLPCYEYAASKLAGGNITREDMDAVDAVVGDVAEAPASTAETSAPADPMKGID